MPVNFPGSLALAVYPIYLYLCVESKLALKHNYTERITHLYISTCVSYLYFLGSQTLAVIQNVLVTYISLLVRRI